MENPADETPGWHASELETSQMLANDESLVRMDRAVKTLTHIPQWLPKKFGKKDGAPDIQFEGYSYFNFPMDHHEFTDTRRHRQSRARDEGEGRGGVPPLRRARRARDRRAARRRSDDAQPRVPGSGVSVTLVARPSPTDVLPSRIEAVVGADRVSTRETDRLIYSVDAYWLPQMWLDRGGATPQRRRHRPSRQSAEEVARDPRRSPTRPACRSCRGAAARARRAARCRSTAASSSISSGSTASSRSTSNRSTSRPQAGINGTRARVGAERARPDAAALSRRRPTARRSAATWRRAAPARSARSTARPKTS